MRIPVIPGVNDSHEDIRGFGEIVKTFGKGIKGIEMLRYNNLVASKYDISGREYTSFAHSGQTDDEMKALCVALEECCGVNCYFI